MASAIDGNAGIDSSKPIWRISGKEETMIIKDEDPVKMVRRVRAEMAREYKTMKALYQYIRELERKDPKCNPALRRRKARKAARSHSIDSTRKPRKRAV